ncbi:Uncharacterized protein Adt_41641 [Abeliophyllum distichum]|uniref:Uncharacterized protein n=1 Tax=Abeliophyllum distichum TaxID=126358 RepID=A0ABD1PPJ1_9LAMI
MVRPKEFSAEQLAGLEWDMDKFLEQKEKTIAPTEALTYRDIHGRTSLRFLNYNHVESQSEGNDEEESVSEPFIVSVHIELIGEDLDRIIFPKELGLILDKKELLQLEEQMYVTKHIQEHEYLYYDLEQNIRVGIIEEDQDNQSEVSYEKDFMESYKTIDDTPFDKTIKHEPFSYGGGFPPRGAYDTYNEPPQDAKFVARGSERPIENKVEFQSASKAHILNLTAHDPQIWNSVIDVWKNTIIGHYIRNFQDMEPLDMYRYLDTFLGESTKAMWEAYKREKKEEFNQLVALGSNPYNFFNKIQILITGADPNSGHMSIQIKAMRDLEQLNLYKWTKGKYVKNFLNEYYYLTAISGNTFNHEIGQKLFHKQPRPLGLEITESWNNLPSVKENPDKKWSIGHRIQHMSRPPLRPGIPPGNTYASSTIMQTSSSQNRTIYQDRIRFAEQSSPNKGKEVLQDSQDPDDDIISINRLLSQIQKLQDTPEKSKKIPTQKKKAVKKKKEDVGKKFEIAINKALERVFTRKEEASEKEIKECHKNPDPEDSQADNEEFGEDKHLGTNNSDRMSFSPTAQHNLDT